MEPTETTEIETVELNYWYEMGEALKELEQMPQFKKVILDGYMRDKALDSVSLLAVDQIKKQGVRGDIMEDLVAISGLGEYFRTIKNFHAGAIQDMQELEEAERNS